MEANQQESVRIDKTMVCCHVNGNSKQSWYAFVIAHNRIHLIEIHDEFEEEEEEEKNWTKLILHSFSTHYAKKSQGKSDSLSKKRAIEMFAINWKSYGWFRRWFYSSIVVSLPMLRMVLLIHFPFHCVVINNGTHRETWRHIAFTKTTVVCYDFGLFIYFVIFTHANL